MSVVFLMTIHKMSGFSKVLLQVNAMVNTIKKSLKWNQMFLRNLCELAQNILCGKYLKLFTCFSS